ncbi:MAG: tRNA pseudouridine(38-40) synthase TruA [Gammaproteobacteria bacterium]
MKIALGIEYQGTNYHGWQKQQGLVTLQGTLEEALSKLADQPIAVQCAGRTDEGVHAFGQVVHLETTARRSIHAWVFGGNNFLPRDIRIQWAKEMPEDFHARFSAVARHYRYIIYNHNVPSALYHERATFYFYKLDEKRMQEAAQYLIGEHDFSAFRGAYCQAQSTVRNITKLEISRSGRIITIEVVANAFLQHMVRNIVGVLLEIGNGDREPIWAREVLESKTRSLGGITAPSTGLYFMQVDYPEKYGLSS